MKWQPITVAQVKAMEPKIVVTLLYVYYVSHYQRAHAQFQFAFSGASGLRLVLHGAIAYAIDTIYTSWFREV